ncbi:MAG: ATP synthase F1 subunit epsilon [Solirubrobacteraceae bacterium]
MAHAKFPCEVLTPEGEVFSEEIEQLSTITAAGSIGVLAGHTPMLAMLEPAELRLYRTETDVVRYAQAEGYMQVAGGRVLILVEEAHDPASLDAAELRERVTRAEEELAAAGEDTEKRRVALRDKNRAEKFLALVG